MYTKDEKIAYIIKSRKDFKTVIIAETVLLVIGIIMIITVAIGHQAHNEFMQSAVSVEATCTRSWRDYEYRGNDNHIDDVYFIKYIIDDEFYQLFKLSNDYEMIKNSLIEK